MRILCGALLRMQALTDIFEWEQPYCGEHYPEDKIAGDPIVCDLDVHGDDTRHLNKELGFEWW